MGANEEHLECEYGNFIEKVEALRTEMEDTNNKTITIKKLLRKLDKLFEGDDD